MNVYKCAAIITCGGPPTGSAEEEGRLVAGRESCGWLGLHLVDRRAQRTEQAGSYWKINHKSSHLSDREALAEPVFSCVADLCSSDC